MKENKNLILYTSLGTLIAICVYYLLLFIHMNLLSFAVLFVIPVGGLLLGTCIGYFAFLGMKRDNSAFTSRKGSALVILSIVLLLFLTALDARDLTREQVLKLSS